MRTNNKRPAVKKDSRTVLNNEGFQVHKLNSLEILFSKVLGSFFGESNFYESRENEFEDIKEIVSSLSDDDLKYLFKIACIGRSHNMIEFPLVLLSAGINDERIRGMENTFADLYPYADEVIRRTSDITEMVALQYNYYGKKLPNLLKKILKKKIESFNAYKLSKGLGIGNDVSLIDVFNLVHPKPSNSRMSDFYKKLMTGTVKVSDYVKMAHNDLSQLGNEKKDIEDLQKNVSEYSLFNLVKNLNALIIQGVFENPDTLKTVCDRLGNEKEILQSKMLPFRFLSAFRSLQSCEISSRRLGQTVKSLSEALSLALDLSIKNLPEIQGYNAILIDVSGSMAYPISDKSGVKALDVALLLGAICYKKGNSDLFLFASSCNEISISKRTPTLEIIRYMRQFVGGCTYIDIAFDMFSRRGIKYDNLLMLSDSDCYFSQGNSFKIACLTSHVETLFNRKIFLNIFLNNLLGKDFAVMNTDDRKINLITSFSEKIIDIINVYQTMNSHSDNDIKNLIDSLYEKIKGGK